MLRQALRRLLTAALVLLAISFLSFLAQDLSLLGRMNQAVSFGAVLKQVAQETAELWSNLLRGNVGSVIVPRGAWQVRSAEQFGGLLLPYLARSLSLLLLAMMLGGVVGGLIGLLAAGWRRPGVAFALLAVSIIGISTPSFFMGTLLQWLEIVFYRHTGVRLLPVGGFGWDDHLVMPVLVLAARPLAQVTRLSYAQFSSIFAADYVRTAKAKGLRGVAIWLKHVWPNGATTVLTAMGTSLRFSLSSLPVVEYMFGWPGAGKALLDTLNSNQTGASTVLLLAMGALSVLVNLILDLAYRLIDPRLGSPETEARPRESWQEWLGGLLGELWAVITLSNWRGRRAALAQTLPLTALTAPQQVDAEEIKADAAKLKRGRRREWVRALWANPSLLAGLVLGLALLIIVAFGPALAPYQVVGTDPDYYFPGTEIRPPLGPGESFALGTDVQGRDILSLLLVGARRTLGIALLATLARIIVGSVLGFVAGWFSGSTLDRALMGVAEALSAFPALLLAMLVVYAVGIRQGLSAFVIGLAFVGWGEVMQTVRAQVLAIKPMDYIESAVSTGLHEGQILSAHVLPNVWPTIVSLAFLEMGGVLMLLGELGFLGVFIGGGLAASGDSMPTVVYYDVPEWSVMLANSWSSFRSYPWTMLYPALAFFLAILAFTFLGEGLRWLSERLTLSLGSVFNRYTFAVAVVLCLAVWGIISESGYHSQHKDRALAFDGARALQDVSTLADPSFNGRLSGTDDANRAAEWLAAEFKAVGLQSAGRNERDYTQAVVSRQRNLTAMPSLVLTSPEGEQITAEFNVDYARYASAYDVGGSGSGEVVMAYSADYWYSTPQALATRFGITAEELTSSDKIMLEPLGDIGVFSSHLRYGGRLIVPQGGEVSPRYELLATSSRTIYDAVPSFELSAELAARMLDDAGYTQEELAALAQNRGAYYIDTGWQAELSLPSELETQVPGLNVLGYWPGEDVSMDNEAIIVAAHYDGLGRTPDGTLYPGANDNASGVATMLEIVRSLKEEGFRPKRTLIFVAYTDGERHEAPDYEEFLQARLGFDQFDVVATMQIAGVGAGSGDGVAVWRSTRERLTQVLTKSARKVGTTVTSRESGLHANADIWPEVSDDIPSVIISWAGADDVSHLPSDDVDHIDVNKLQDVGEMVSLAIMVLATDPSY